MSFIETIQIADDDPEPPTKRVADEDIPLKAWTQEQLAQKS